MGLDAFHLKLCLMLIVLLVLLSAILYCANQGWEYAVAALIGVICPVLMIFVRVR